MKEAVQAAGAGCRCRLQVQAAGAGCRATQWRAVPTLPRMRNGWHLTKKWGFPPGRVRRTCPRLKVYWSVDG